MDPAEGVVEVQSDSEYEEWLPAVIKRWNAFEGGETNAKQYTAFLRFVFKAYSIPARVCIRWMNQNNRPRSNKCRVLQIRYDGRARTMEEMRGNFKEIWEIISAFPTPLCLEYEYESSLTAVLKFGSETHQMAPRTHAWLCVLAREPYRTCLPS